MKSFPINSTDIWSAINTAIEGDACLRRQFHASHHLVSVVTDQSSPFEPLNVANLPNGIAICAIQIWPATSHISLLGFRISGKYEHGFPLPMCKTELTLDWISEVSALTDTPLVTNILCSDVDAPVCFSHTAIRRFGNAESQFDIDVQDLMDRFPRVVERVVDRILFLSSILTEKLPAHCEVRV